jgi:hypothetical protein
MVMRDISVKPHQTMIYSHRSPDEKDNLADRSPPLPIHISSRSREKGDSATSSYRCLSPLSG